MMSMSKGGKRGKRTMKRRGGKRMSRKMRTMRRR